jgi:ABC-type uncharacterized transport system involved in gliding motility auxiliary subunit
MKLPIKLSARHLTPVCLLLGFAGLLLAAGAAVMQRQFNVYVQSGLAVGLLGFALAMLLNPGTVMAWLGTRQARYGGNTALMVVLFLAIIVLINYLVATNPMGWDTNWDATEDKTNTLAPETLDALAQLQGSVRAVGFYSPNFISSQQTAEDLLDRYKVESGGKFTYEMHDPVSEPLLARDYGVTADGSLIIVMGDQREEVSFATEQQITGALIRLMHPGARKLYFLTGHGEKGTDDTGDSGLSQAISLLENQNYEIAPLNLQLTATVPTDARAVIVAGPLLPVPQEEVDRLDAYLQGGGALVVMLDPPGSTQTDPGTPEPMVDYLKTKWGVDVPQDIVIDPASNPATFAVTDSYGQSDITQKLARIFSVFPVARSLIVSGTPDTYPNITYTPLVATYQQAWSETDFAGLTQGVAPTMGEGDTQGPLTLGVAVEDTQLKSRLVVYGDSDFASNYVSQQSGGLVLFLNSVNWAATEESLINLTTNIPTTRTLKFITTATGLLILFFTVVLMPVAVLVWGGVVWFQRRRHA